MDNCIPLKVILWNIGSALEDLCPRMEHIIKLIEEHDPDLVFFQEFPYSNDHIRRILSCGSFVSHIYYECSPSHVAAGWNMGLCVFSKYPLRAHSIYPLTIPDCRIFYKGKEEFWHPKYFLHTGIQINGTPVDLFTGHSFPFYRYELNVQDFAGIFQGIDKWIDQQATGLRIVCADFNCPNAIDHMPRLRQTHRDIFANVATRPSGRKTDAVIVPFSAKVLSEINQVLELDHNFLFAELLLNGGN